MLNIVLFEKQILNFYKGMFLLVDRKGHNPNYTEEAIKYLGEFRKARSKLLKKKSLTEAEKAIFVASFDWNKMTEQDETVWKRIFECLDE